MPTTLTVPVLAKGKTRTGRLWTYVRDDRPFAGRDPPAAIFFYSADRGGEHPEQHLASYAGLMQADAYAGFKRLYESRRKAGATHRGGLLGACEAQVLRLARMNKAPIATEAVERIDALFAIEREVNGVTPHERVRIRDERSRLLVISTGKPGCASSAPRSPRTVTPARPSTTASSCWARSPASSMTAASACPTTPPNASYVLLPSAASNWTFAGSDEGGRRAAAIYTLIATAKLNDIDPQAWLADVLARLPDHPAKRIHDLLPWNWRPHRIAAEAA